MSGRTSELTAAGGLDFDEMELTLGLPGESRKRRFSDTLIDFKLGSLEKHEANESDGECSDNFDPTRPPSKERVVGWPPVRSYRKNSSNCKYVKVAVDGAPYLRKVDLRSYTCYQQLLGVIQDIMFPGFTIHNHVLDKSKIMDHVNRSEHVPTYEDKDGDWMLVGDVPWKMFVETCKRIRLMKSSEAINQLASSKNST